MKYEYELDGVRALAVFGVVLFHLGIYKVSGGFTGVDVFFVLSGYLITALITKQKAAGSFSFVEFYLRRARRLLPALFLVIIISAIFAFLLLSPEHFQSFAKSAFHAVISVSNISFWLETGYFDPSKYTKPLLHTWSLAVEEQFYLFWPITLVVLLKLKGLVSRAGILCLIVVLGFAAQIYYLNQHPSAVFYLAPFRMWQFAAGGLLAILLHSSSGAGRSFSFPIIFSVGLTGFGLALISFGFLTLSQQDYPGFNALIPTAGTLLIILGGQNFLSKIVLANPVAKFFGKISYSLYLTHWPIIVFWRYWDFAPLSAIEMILVTLLSILSAWLLHKFIETPLRKPWRSDPVVEKFAVPAVLASSMLFLILSSSYPWIQKGWSWRVSDQVTAIRNKTAPNRTVRCVRKKTAGCYFGYKDGDVRIVLIGDSHARALSLGLEKEFKKNKFEGRSFIIPGVAPFFNAVSVNGTRRIPKNFNGFYNSLPKQDKPDYVIVHARFALHWLTIRPENEDQTIRKFVGLATDNNGSLSLAASQRNFLDTYDLTLQKLKDSRTKFIVVGSVPIHAKDTFQCIDRPAYLFSHETLLKNCSGKTREEVLKRIGVVNSILAEKAENYGGSFYDPADIFCPGERCVTLSDGISIYRDDDHLSHHGATILAKEIVKIVKEQETEKKQSGI